MRSLHAAVPLLIVAASPVLAQPGLPRVETQRARIVEVRGTFPADEQESGNPQPSFGAGIILAVTAETLYVATARHVVLTSGTIPARDLTVRLRMPGQRPRSAVIRASDSGADLAVLAVAVRGDPIDLRSIPYLRLASPDSVPMGELLYGIGAPGGTANEQPVIPGTFAGTGGVFARIQTWNVEPGHSGGGLFTRRGDLVAMISRGEIPSYYAVRADTVLARAARWGVPVQVQPPRRDPFEAMFTLGVAGSIAASAPPERRAEVWLERTTNLGGDFRNFLATPRGSFQGLVGARFSTGPGAPFAVKTDSGRPPGGSVTAYVGVGYRVRFENINSRTGPTRSAAVFLDLGTPLVTPGEPPFSGLTAGLGLRYEWIAWDRIVTGVVMEGRINNRFGGGAPRDRLAFGLTLGLGR